MGLQRGDEDHPEDSGGSKLQRYAIKRRTKKWFRRMVTPKNKKGIPEFRRRRDAAVALANVLDMGAHGSHAVLRRFTKSDPILQDGLAAVLIASDDDPLRNQPLSETSVTGKILTLLFQQANPLHQALPQCIASKDFRSGAAGALFILRLSNSTPKDMDAWVNYCCRIMRRNRSGVGAWCHSLSLLEYLIRRYPDTALRSLTAPHEYPPEAALERVGWIVIVEPPSMRCRAWFFRPRASTLQLIRSIYQSSRPAVESPLRWMLRSGFAVALANIVIDRTSVLHLHSCSRGEHPECLEYPDAEMKNSWQVFVSQRPYMRCLALAALVPVLEFPEMRQEILEEGKLRDAFFETCFDVLLGRTEWQFDIDDDRVCHTLFVASPLT